MAKIVDLKGQPALTPPSQRAVDVQELLDDIASRNAREEVQSILFLWVDYNGNTYTSSVREVSHDTALLGHIDILKSDLLDRIRRRREVIGERPA